MRLTLCLLVLSLSGCARLRPDRGGVAIDHGYTTAEIIFRGEHLLGGGMFSAPRGSQIEFAVQGYYGGRVLIESRDCDVHINRRYEGNELVTASANLGERRQCLFTITVSPEYTDEMRDGLVVHGFRGHLAIRAVSPSDAWVGDAMKLARGGRHYWAIPASGGEATVVLDGCGVAYERTLPVAAGVVAIPVYEAVGEPSLCVLDGFVINGQTDTTLNALVIQYDNGFVPLPAPLLIAKERRLRVVGDPAVSIVALDGSYAVDREAEFEFNAAVAHVLRLLTVNGRAVLGVYRPGTGWSFQQ